MRVGLIGTGRIGGLHARTLRRAAGVTEVLVADAAPERARALADELGLRAVDQVADLYRDGVDGVVVAAPTDTHAELVHQALAARTPVFCEKPVALDVAGTREVAEHAASAGVPLQVGFQRRFDAGYRAAREAVREGRLGWLHTLRAVTADQFPPHASFIPTSGGLFRDCSLHDFDILHWLTGRTVVSVQALGANRGAAFFREGGDVDTCAALLRFDDDTLGMVSASRYNGAGHDVRLEVCGCEGSLVVGLDDRAALPTAEPHVSWRRGRPYRTFMERFHAAYVAELEHFAAVAAGRATVDCGAPEALAALYVAEACELSRSRGGAPVEVAEVRS